MGPLFVAAGAFSPYLTTRQNSLRPEGPQLARSVTDEQDIPRSANGESMDDATLYGRRLLSGGTVTVLVAAGLALMAIFAYAPGGSPATTSVAVLASVGLVDDDGHQGLFNVNGLTPGRSASRCMQVQYGGPSPAGAVYFSASEITGPLAANLRIKVEQGYGGSYSSCAGFSGTAIYEGPLVGLVDPDPTAPRTNTGWSPTASDVRTYRLTATLRDNVAVQNQNSTATFHWFLFGAPLAATTEPTATEPAVVEAEPTLAPEVVPTPDPTPAITAAPTSAAPRAVDDRSTPTRSQSTAAPTVAAPPDKPEDKSPVAQVRKVLEDLGRDITEVAQRTSTHSALPVTGLAVLLGFLTVQNRIDRMDPKLAMAPAQDPHLEFREPETDPDDPEHAPRPDEAAP